MKHSRQTSLSLIGVAEQVSGSPVDKREDRIHVSQLKWAEAAKATVVSLTSQYSTALVPFFSAGQADHLIEAVQLLLCQSFLAYCDQPVREKFMGVLLLDAWLNMDAQQTINGRFRDHHYY